jgi:Zn2+/Cd2+-exporting ATPase
MIEQIKSIPLGRRRKDPFVFRTFFEMGSEESASPFLNYSARRLSQNLSLKTSLLSAVLLCISYAMAGSAISEVLLLTVYVIAGAPSLIDSIEDILFHRDINIDVLMTVAAFSAYFLGAQFEGALLLVLFALSGAIEAVVTLRAKNALSLIHSIAPTKAYLIDDENQIYERAIEDISIGSHIFVRTGEVVPLDGIIIAGSSLVDLAHLTGESRPIRKTIGDAVPSGARLIDGTFTLQVTHTSYESTVARIIELITKAQEARPRLERWFDKFGRLYATSIITLAILAALFFAHVLHLPYIGQEGAIYRALAFLITASPCALILAVPIAYLSALGACARKGIILKGGIVLDGLNECSMIAFDKTGTLTLGDLHLTSITSISGGAFSEQEVLCIAASLERNAVHPIAKAIMTESEGLELKAIKDVKVIPGYGVEGTINIRGTDYKAFIGDVKISAETTSFVKEIKQEFKIIAALIVGDKKYILSFEDRVRPDVTGMLQRLKESGHKVLMLTGDRKESAEHIASLIGIDEFYAELKPEDKLNKISLLSKNYGLAMVGDGMNDAPALARATVGISLGQIGSATAQAASDCILLHDNVEYLDWLFQKAHKTKKIVRENVTIALTAIIFASIPALYGIVPLWLAVILHEGGTVLVGLNALRLLKK